MYSFTLVVVSLADLGLMLFECFWGWVLRLSPPEEQRSAGDQARRRYLSVMKKYATNVCIVSQMRMVVNWVVSYGPINSCSVIFTQYIVC